MFSLNIIPSLVYDFSGRSGEAAVLLDQQTQFLRQVPCRAFFLPWHGTEGRALEPGRSFSVVILVGIHIVLISKEDSLSNHMINLSSMNG